MFSNLKILALIPARCGSKTIPHKNIASIGGKPMLAHSIDHAFASKYINRTVVSTDSEYYAQIAKQYKAEVPFLRPEKYATDTSTDLEVFTHCLKFFLENENYKPDICVHLRPTYPIRNVEDIDRMIEILMQNKEGDSIRSVAKAPETPYKMWFLKDKNELVQVVDSDIKEAYNMPRQQLPQVYLQNACIDVVRTSVIMEQRSMTGKKILGYVMNENYDIDTLEQFDIAGNVINNNRVSADGKKFCFDIDGVIALLSPQNDYNKAMPNKDVIEIVNVLYQRGNEILLHTARGSETGIDWREKTEIQLKEWGVLYHTLSFGKPAADFYVDDRMLTVMELKKMIE